MQNQNNIYLFKHILLFWFLWGFLFLLGLFLPCLYFNLILCIAIIMQKLKQWLQMYLVLFSFVGFKIWPTVNNMLVLMINKRISKSIWLNPSIKKTFWRTIYKTRGQKGPWVAHLRKRSKVTVEPFTENH